MLRKGRLGDGIKKTSHSRFLGMREGKDIVIMILVSIILIHIIFFIIKKLNNKDNITKTTLNSNPVLKD